MSRGDILVELTDARHVNSTTMSICDITVELGARDPRASHSCHSTVIGPPSEPSPSASYHEYL
jgi:hypothetical protein